jgi:hypothetical protein
MTKQYMFGMFILCFCVWTVVVDNVFLPSDTNLPQDVGAYTRYRVKKWTKGSKLDVINDELLIYVIVKNREQLYYMEHKSYFENTLKYLPAGTPVQVRYKRGFPKIWKRHLYSMRENGIPIIRYSAAQIHQKQREIWKFTGIMGGVYLVFVVLGLINKPRQK